MSAATHLIPRAGVDDQLEAIRRAGASNLGAGSGLLYGALTAIERHDGPCDLVLVAVPAGTGADVARTLEQDGGR